MITVPSEFAGPRQDGQRAKDAQGGSPWPGNGSSCTAQVPGIRPSVIRIQAVPRPVQRVRRTRNSGAIERVILQGRGGGELDGNGREQKREERKKKKREDELPDEFGAGALHVSENANPVHICPAIVQVGKKIPLLRVLFLSL